MRVVFIKNAFLIKSTWDDFIKTINEAISCVTKTKMEEENYKRKGLIRFYDQLTLVIDNALKFNYLKKDAEAIDKYLSENKLICEFELAIVSFTDSEKTTGKHADHTDIFYVQFIGSAIWKIWDKNQEKIYVLNPGDAIFVPKNIEHEVQSISPRAAVSYCVKNEK